MQEDRRTPEVFMFPTQRTTRVFEWPKKGKLAAIVQKEEEQEENKIASLKLLNAIHAKVEKQPRGRMYVETLINDKSLQALFDTRADTVYMAKELADEVGLSYIKEGGVCKRSQC